MSSKKVAALLCALVLGQTAFTQILFYKNSTVGALFSVATHATGTPVARVNGATIPGNPCASGFSSANYAASTTWSSTQAAIEVSVTPSSGYQLNVTGFTADLRRSSTGPVSARLAYSTNGGATWIDQGSNKAPNNAGCGTTITGSWATNVTVLSPNALKFRIYGFRASSTSGTLQVLNLSILGTVPLTCVVPAVVPTSTAASCFGSSDGSISLGLTGGTPPFTFLWSNGATTQNITGLASGTYTVTVTAAGGCTTTATAVVSQPAPLTALITAQTNVGCGGTNGQATVTASGGTSTYRYLWSMVPAQTTATATGLSADNYSVTVSDFHGCTAVTSAAISVLSPSGLSTSGITVSSATLAWNTVNGATSYNIQYRPIGTSLWTAVTATSASVTVTGLTAATTYEFLVQSVCAAGASSFSPASNFTTTASVVALLAYTSATDGTLSAAGPHATGTPLVRVNGALGSSNPCATGFSTTNFTNATVYASSLPAIEVSLTPETGYTLNITEFRADLRRSLTGPAAARFAYSTDGGTTWVDQGTDQSPSNAGCGVATTSIWPTSLTLAAPSSLKLRIHGFNASGTSGVLQVLNLLISGSVSGGSGGGGGGVQLCDRSLWNHIYNPDRLIVLDSCTSMNGIVANKINEADGDVHIRVTPDPDYAWMINSYNTSGQHGDIVVEPVCVVTITQTDAVAACVGFSNSVYIPNIGEHVVVTGCYATDNGHGWNEIHPVSSIAIIPAKTAPADAGSLTDAQIKIYPNPVDDHLTFEFEGQPSSVIYVALTNELGQLAGQYQLLETHELKLRTRHLPSGRYYYSVMQDGALIKGGFVMVMH